MSIVFLELPSALRVQQHKKQLLNYQGFPYAYALLRISKTNEYADLGNSITTIALNAKTPTLTGVPFGRWLTINQGAIGKAIILHFFDRLPSASTQADISRVQYVVRSELNDTECRLLVGSRSSPLEQWLGL